jgi:hypothetical protein
MDACRDSAKNPIHVLLMLGVITSGGNAFGSDHLSPDLPGLAQTCISPDSGMRPDTQGTFLVTVAVASEGLGEKTILIMIFIVVMGATAGRKATGDENVFYRSNRPVQDTRRRK